MNGSLRSKSLQHQGTGQTTPSTDSGPSQSRTPKSIGNIQGPSLGFGEEFQSSSMDLAAAKQSGDAAQATPHVHCPERLWVITPSKPELQGEYAQLLGWVANGEPIWRHVSGHSCLFSCTAGRWMVTDHYSKIEMNQGQVRTVDPHYEKLPHQCSRWMYGESSNWIADAQGLTTVIADKASAQRRLQQQEQQSSGKKQHASLRAVQAPTTLWLAAPPKPALQGEYCRVQDRVENGQPVWRHVQGNGWLFSSASKHWMFCSKEPGADKNPGQLKSAMPHQGKWPQDVKEWKYARSSGGAWASDSVKQVQVSTDAALARAALKNYVCQTPRGDVGATPVGSA